MTSHTFRSNIMKQLLANARHQSRPPMALMGWLNELNDEECSSVRSMPPCHLLQRRHSNNSTSGGSALSTLQTRTLTTSSGTVISRAGPRSVVTAPETTVHVHQQSSSSRSSSGSGATGSTSSSGSGSGSPRTTQHPSTRRSSSITSTTTASSSSSRFFSVATSPLGDSDLDELELPELFQKLIQTRRTGTHLAPLSTTLPAIDPSFWIDALDRAVMCGCAAPNHKRTEPFSFKRLIAPSPTTQLLSNIAYQVQLRRHNKTKNDTTMMSPQEEAEVEASARRKQQKWNEIPAFLITTVRTPHRSLYPDVNPETPAKNEDGDDDWLYTPLPFQPLTTEREMEDYASACAAVQNVLLSLHSEGIASKWATGPIIQTPAFRELLQLHDEERVVALIQVGLPDESKSHHKHHHHRKQHRRSLHGDVLIDL